MGPRVRAKPEISTCRCDAPSTPAPPKSHPPAASPPSDTTVDMGSPPGSRRLSRLGRAIAERRRRRELVVAEASSFMRLYGLSPTVLPGPNDRAALARASAGRVCVASTAIERPRAVHPSTTMGA